MEVKMKNYKEYINYLSQIDESSMSRLLIHLSNYDCVFISAFRDAMDCSKGKPYTLKENIARNKVLKAKLLRYGYGVTTVKGVYIENYGSKYAKEVNVETFFVVNMRNHDRFKQTLLDLGYENEQDSIIYFYTKTIDKVGNIDMEMISTNECSKAYPGFGKIGVVKSYKKINLHKTNMFMTIIRNFPFYLSEPIDNKLFDYANANIARGMGIDYIANSDWRTLVE
jgi:hypothetical protein